MRLRFPRIELAWFGSTFFHPGAYQNPKLVRHLIIFFFSRCFLSSSDLSSKMVSCSPPPYLVPVFRLHSFILPNPEIPR